MVGEASHENARERAASPQGAREFIKARCKLLVPRTRLSFRVKLSRDFSRLPKRESLLTVENFSTIKPLIRGEGVG